MPLSTTELSCRTSIAELTALVSPEHCTRSCHTLSFDPDDPGRTVPHGDPEAVLQVLVEYYSARLLGSDPDAAQQRVRRPGAKLSRADRDKVAAEAKKNGIPVLYYITPKVWAWRPGRVKKIKRLTDHAAVILPFEEQFFRSRGMHATFTGHPLLDIQYAETNIAPRKTAGSKIIGLLPGSRRSEIIRHLPVLLESASIMNKHNRDLKFLISVAPSAD